MAEIGFKPLARGWEGPIVLEFRLHSEHSETARYQAQLAERSFDLYAPLLMLPGFERGAFPQRVVAAIGKGPASVQVLGFSPTDYRPTISPEVCEYEFDEKKVNSFKYSISQGGTRYALYVPLEVFAGEAPPQRIYLKLGLRTEP